jgi:hypothetical protein
MLSKGEIMAAILNGEITPEEVERRGWLSSVTQRIAKVKQPYGGYIRPRDLEETVLGPGIDALCPDENIRATAMGTAVDYLTRVQMGSKPEDVFSDAIHGADEIGNGSEARALVDEVVGLDDASLAAAAKLSMYDAVYRAGSAAYVPIGSISPDAGTLSNMRTMVNRSMTFFDLYGPKVADGLTFEGGYTAYIATGDGDFMTADTLWDFKVSKRKPSSKHTLQLLVYWRMGLHSVHPEYGAVRFLGIYNPRLNAVYRISVDAIPGDVVDTVENEVIGYDE